MKNIFKIIILVTLLIDAAVLNAQDYSSAGSYMEYFGEQYKPVSKDMWDYMSAIARGKNARKVENRRRDLLNTITNTKRKLEQTKPFKGDSGLRDTSISYLTLNYDILNEEYAKIVDLEEIAEQSYDLMESYIKVRRMAGEKMNSASEALEAEENRFAAQNNIHLVKNETKLSKKLSRASSAFNYYDDMFLIYFKSQIQESNVVEALNKQDFTAAEQSKNSLSQYATEGLEALTKVKPYQGDATLMVACRNLFNFYKKETKDKMPLIIDFYLKKENFDEMKKIMDSKSKSATREEIETYNKSMKEYNAMINKFNLINDEINKERAQRVNDWNNAVKNFLDNHAS